MSFALGRQRLDLVCTACIALANTNKEVVCCVSGLWGMVPLAKKTNTLM